MQATSEQSAPCDVLVVGAGPTGLVAALCLAQNGAPVRIVDKEAGPHIGQRGAGVMPRTLEMYKFLGVLHDILDASRPFPPMRSYKLPGGTEALRTWDVIERADPSASVPYSSPVTLGQDRAELILTRHLERHGVVVERNTTLSTLEQNADSVTAHVVRPSATGNAISETIKVKYLLGADGAHGVTRKQLRLSFLGEGWDRKERILIGDLRVIGLDMNHWHMWGDPKTAMVSFRPTERVGENLFAIFAMGADMPSETLASDHTALKDFIKQVSGRTDFEIQQIVWVADYRPHVRMVNKFGEGRVFVAGDSAHVHSAAGAQGMNSSVMDAMNIAWKLALACKSLARPTLMDTYSDERMPVIAEMLNLTTTLVNNSVKERSANTTPWQGGRELHQLCVNYRASGIVRDEISATHIPMNSYRVAVEGEQLVAGDRAPEAPGLMDAQHGTRTSLFEHFRATHHTALIFAVDQTSTRAILDALRSYPPWLVHSIAITPGAGPGHTYETANVTVQDKGGYAFMGYGVSPEATSVVVVRPDGFIGAVVRSADGVRTYFSLILNL